MAASQCPQRSFGRTGGRSAAGADAPPGTGLDHLWRVESSQEVFDLFGGGHRDSVDLVGGNRAGLDGGAASHAEGADRLHAAVCGLGHSGSLAAERGSGRGLGVDGVALAAPAARLAVRAVHLDDLDAGRGEVPGEARTVGSGALHAHTAHRAP